MGFNLDSYETVEERLVKFWEAHPEGRILTNIHHYDDNKVVIKAEIYFNREDERPVATGYAEEVRGSSPVNKTAHVENADTSAIGRGLANCGFQSKAAPRPSRQEMQKVERYNSAPAPRQQQSMDEQASIDALVDQLADSFGGEVVSSAGPKNVTIKNPGEPASVKQIGMIRALMGNQGIRAKQEQLDLASATLGKEIDSLDSISKGDASALITALK